MQTKTASGINRTGVQIAPLMAQKMSDAQDDVPLDGAPRRDSDVRLAYAKEAEPLGSVPLPGSAQRTARSAAAPTQGKRPPLLIDKLGERLAFERGGVRLYEALMVKCRAAGSPLDKVDVQRIAAFRDEEAEHFEIVAEALRTLGADPTAQTPSADLVGVESQGLVQAMNDPRTNLLQALHVMLDAELLDNAGWELLIELAQSAGHGPLADAFQIALNQESHHLSHLRSLVGRLTLEAR